MDRSQRKQASVLLLQLVIVLDPKVVESLQSHERSLSALLHSGFGLCVAREPTRTHEQTDVLISQNGHEGADSIDADLVLTTLHLDLNTRHSRSERVVVRQDVN